MISYTTGNCRALTSLGNPCRLKAVREGGYCQHHDPDPEAVERRRLHAVAAALVSVEVRREQKERARAYGPIRLKTTADALDLLERAVNGVLGGKLDTPRARLLIHAANSFLQHAGKRDLAERLKELEEQVREFDLSAGSWEGIFDSIRSLREWAPKGTR